jgi:hypothetical protein
MTRERSTRPAGTAAQATAEGRRSTLRRLAASLVAVAAGRMFIAHARGAKEYVCADPKALSEAENRQRGLDNYTERSADPNKTCRGCSFFSAAAEPTACGRCAIFNGPADPRGRCDDWAARTA